MCLNSLFLFNKKIIISFSHFLYVYYYFIFYLYIDLKVYFCIFFNKIIILCYLYFIPPFHLSLSLFCSGMFLLQLPPFFKIIFLFLFCGCLVWLICSMLIEVLFFTLSKSYIYETFTLGFGRILAS